MVPGSERSCTRSPLPVSGEHISALNTIRCRRGRVLFRAHRRRIVRVGDYDYRIPSQYGGGLYNVCLEPGAEHCSCPDFARYGRTNEEEPAAFACKHLYAALMMKVKTRVGPQKIQSDRRAEAA